MAEYAKRLPAHFATLNLIEVTPQKRTNNCNIARIKQLEGEQLLAAIAHVQIKHGNSLVIALDEGGVAWSTQELAYQLQQWHDNWSQVSLLIGGADGLAEQCLQRASVKWSLSKLTFPHHLVRVIVAEQIYRAWSLLHHHPYHRV